MTNHQTAVKSNSLCDTTISQQESVADFLIRIDSSIARTKNQVENFQKRSNDTSLEQELSHSSRFNTPRLLSTNTSLYSSSTSKSLFEETFPRISVNNNRKKISLRRLEKSQEEIFEL